MARGERIAYATDVAIVGANQFVTGTEESNMRLDAQPPGFLPDDTYSQVLDAFISTCVDLVLICPDGKVLLGRRQQEPHPDWWIIGGRMRCRETFYLAANRNSTRELGINLDMSRFDESPLGAFSLMWDTREQEPQENGRHDLSLPFIYRLSPRELRSIRPNQEYAGMKPFDIDEVIDGPAFHPALRAILLAAKQRLRA